MKVSALLAEDWRLRGLVGKFATTHVPKLIINKHQIILLTSTVLVKWEPFQTLHPLTPPSPCKLSLFRCQTLTQGEARRAENINHDALHSDSVKVGGGVAAGDELRLPGVVNDEGSEVGGRPDRRDHIREQEKRGESPSHPFSGGGRSHLGV